MLGKSNDLFVDWLINEHHYATDGVPLSIIKKYINTEEKITEFHKYFKDMYNSDPDYINSCLFETVSLYRESNIGQLQLLTEIV